MRFHAPPRERVDPAVFAAPLFDEFRAWQRLWQGPDWPALDALNAELAPPYRFVEQTPALLADGLHYEQRIATRRAIATRVGNWHDLFNALIWLRHRPIKQAMNARQAADVARLGPRQRSRAQCALTHFDEAGIVLLLRDPQRMAAWDRHDWVGLFGGLRLGDFAVAIIGHALLEHALEPERLLVGKAIAVHATAPPQALAEVLDGLAGAIGQGELLCDPQELRPLPLMGLPGWHARAGDTQFLREAPCFQPKRAGRRYPPPISAAMLSCEALGEESCRN